MQTTAGGGPTVLVADEDAPERAFLADNFQADGFRILLAGDLAEARARLAIGCDLAVADLNGSTLALVEDLAEPRVPTIVLAHHHAAADWHAIRALERGCDDYVRKPFSYGELLGRVRALLRRSCSPTPAVLAAGRLRIDLPPPLFRARRRRARGRNRAARPRRGHRLMTVMSDKPTPPPPPPDPPPGLGIPETRGGSIPGSEHK